MSTQSEQTVSPSIFTDLVEMARANETLQQNAEDLLYALCPYSDRDLKYAASRLLERDLPQSGFAEWLEEGRKSARDEELQKLLRAANLQELVERYINEKDREEAERLDSYKIK